MLAPCQRRTIAAEKLLASMGWILFLLFVGLPIIEIGVLIKAGEIIGLWPTVGLVILTAAAGAALARAEGRAAMQRLAASVESGEQPVGPLLDAAAIFAGGIMLLTPGFVTDALGLSLLFRPTRFLWGQAFAALRRRSAGRRGGYDARVEIVEGEFEVRENRPPDEGPPGPPPGPNGRIGP